MLCQSLIEELGFICTAVDTHSQSAFRLTTPVDFADGQPISFYIEQLNNGYSCIKDGGEIIFHLLNTGLLNNERKSWRSIGNIAEKHQFNLAESGEFNTYFRTDNRPSFLNQALGFAYSLKQWEQERLGRGLDDLFFVDEVEIALRAWKPNSEITKKPSLAGYSRKSYIFDLKMDDLLVDTLKPHSRSTASKLRKILDIQKGPFIAPMLFIVDDRENTEKAKTERDIIGGISKAMLFSDIPNSEFSSLN